MHKRMREKDDCDESITYMYVTLYHVYIMCISCAYV